MKDPKRLISLSGKDLTYEGIGKQKVSHKLPKPGGEVEEEPGPGDSLEEESVSDYNSDSEGIQSFLLINQFTDVGQDYQISKSLLDEASSRKFFNICSDQINLLGLYGDRKECYKVAQIFLQADSLPKIKKDEALLCLYSPETSRAALIYLTSSITYKEKPIKSNSDSILFVKYLFDLCPVVVACPSSTILTDWYSSDEPELQNPFLVKKHQWGTVRITRSRARESELAELRVRTFRNALPHTYVTADRSNIYYQYNISTPKLDSMAIQISQLLQTCVQNKIRDLYKSPYQIESFIKSLQKEVAERSRAYSINCNRVIIQIKQIVDESNSVIESIKQFHIDSLLRELKKMKFLETVSGWFERKSSLSESFNLLQNEIVQIKAIAKNTSEKLVGTYLKKFMDGGDKKDQERRSCELLNKCLISIEKEIDTYITSDLSNKVILTIKSGFKGLEKDYSTTCKLFKYAIEHIIDTDEIALDKTGESIMLRPKITHGVLKQIIQLGDFCYALFASTGFTYISKFMAKNSIRIDIEECSSIADEDCFIAWGSDLQRFVLFQNTNKSAYYGPVVQTRQFDRGIAIPVYSDRNTIVKSAIYQSKKKKLIYIDQDGHLYSCDLVADNKLILPIRNESNKSSESSTLGGSEFLKPKTGPSFLEIQSTSSENILFLRTIKAIELYDSNFVCLKEIKLQPDFFAFKTIYGNGQYYIVIFGEARNTCYYYKAAHESKSVTNTPMTRREIPGNPIADTIHLCLKKFGDSDTLSRHARKLYFHIPDDQYESIVIEYVNSLKSIQESIRFCGRLEEADIDRIIRKPRLVKALDFKWALYTRVPLHIGALQNGNLYPMQNGTNNFENIITSLEERPDFLESLINELQFGHYEHILQDLNVLKVVSIIGRQSSGKSYLLNKLFGTRFAVAAHRCTNGIWMSLAKLKGQFFVVFDCEGLFSMERTFQEEMKLCLFLSAVSDIVILNQDLTFNRSLTYLFEKFANGVDRINGSNLFKGKLEIAIRDVGMGEDEETIQQIDSFLQKLIESGQDEFLQRLFNGYVDYSLYHNFENQELFNHGLQAGRQKYLTELTPRWNSGKTFSDTIKTILVNIMSDNSNTVDKDLFKIMLKKYWQNFIRLADGSAHDESYIFKYDKDINIDGMTRPICINIYDLQINEASPTQPFDDLLLSVFPETLKITRHSKWYIALNELMIDFFEHRNQELIQRFENQLPKSDEIEDIRQNEIHKANEHLRVIANRHILCLRKCNECDQVCVLQDKHTVRCSCNTDHKCKELCHNCKSEGIMCSFSAEHKGKHVCGKADHVCKKFCHITGCGQECRLKPEHEGDCICSKRIHECKEKCKMYDDCKQFCKIDVLQPHEDNHSCLQGRCSKPCYFKDGFCSSTDHLHDIDPKISTAIDPITGETKKIHLCGSEHLCKEKCEQEGICDVSYIPTVRVWESSSSKFEYRYFEIKQQVNNCILRIHRNNIQHPGRHICSNTQHKCENRCPDCGAFCDGPYGHSDLHFSNTHRNKEKCVFISKTENFDKEVDDKVPGSSTVHTFSAGESASPEFCLEACVRRGRGHTHPVECLGGDQCAEYRYPGQAKHSNERFHPYPYKHFDLLKCSTYWRKFGWRAPVKSTMPAMQKKFGLCNFICSHPSHLNQEEPQFCTEKLFHSSESNYSSHTFDCEHEDSGEYDICFILDCTGSMSAAFPQVKQSIIEIISRWDDLVSIRTAVVCYTDHAPDNGHFPADIPVLCYPRSKNLEDADPDSAIEFIDDLTTGGGGPNLGEAMIDGLHVASLLKYRPDSEVIAFIIGDDTPHGSEFIEGTTYPDGCPCGTSWRRVLERMKRANIDLKFIKLKQIVQKTIDNFNEVYDGKMEVMTLQSLDNLGPQVTLKVTQKIEQHMEFANK